MMAKASLPHTGGAILNTIIATTVVYEIFGPVATRYALLKAKDTSYHIPNIFKQRDRQSFILKPIWFLAFQKTKSWLQLYSGKIVFGFSPKTILRWV